MAKTPYLTSKVAAYKNLIEQMRAKKSDRMSPEKLRSYIKRHYFRNSPSRTAQGRHTSQERKRPLHLQPQLLEKVNQLKQRRQQLVSSIEGH